MKKNILKNAEKMLGLSLCPKIACIWRFCIEYDFHSSPSCWATPDHVTHSLIIWRDGMLLTMKRAYLVSLRKLITASQRQILTWCIPVLHQKWSFPDFSKAEYLFKTTHKEWHLQFLEGFWKLWVFLWVSPTRMFQLSSSHLPLCAFPRRILKPVQGQHPHQI